MARLAVRGAVALAIALSVAFFAGRCGLPEPAVLPAAAYAGEDGQGGEETAVLAGGCFWGIEAVFEHVKGVIDVVSGYAGGSVRDPSYELVTTGATGHAEAVRITFDPSQVSYGELLRVFFSVAHDPTQLNRQGPDVGTQYRSAIFTHSPEQERLAREAAARAAERLGRPVATQIVPAETFWPAEEYHQQYLVKNGRATCAI